jgi:nitroreductase
MSVVNGIFSQGGNEWMADLQVKHGRQAEYDIDENYLNRWSPRSFLEKEVPHEDLMSVLEAARWAPSAMNAQPWRFIIARTQEDREKFHSFIKEGNRIWCEKAPVLVAILSDNKVGYHAFDTGSSWGYLSLQATQKGLITHPMAGFYQDQARQVLNIPDDFDIQLVVAIGYQGEKVALPAELQDREQPTNRRPLKESIFEGEYK